MNISDLEHLEVVSKKTNLVGGSYARSEVGGTYAKSGAESNAWAKGDETNTETTAKTFSYTYQFHTNH